MKVKVVERFLSIQGEGITTGIPTYFIRLAGCNLRCVWCDTEYAFYGGEEAEIEVLVNEALNSGAPRVCITGGEPLLQKGTLELTKKLIGVGLGVDLETNGTLPLKDLLDVVGRERRLNGELPTLLISMDVKCPSSGESGKTHWENLSLLRRWDQVKFVISDERDLNYALEVLRTHKIKAEVVFTPVWGRDFRLLAELFLKEISREESLLKGLNVRFLLQMHKFIWKDEREGINR